MGADGDAVRDRMPIQLLHRIIFGGFQRQIAVLVIAFQETAAFEEFRHTLADPMGQQPQLVRRWCLDAVKSGLAVSIFGKNSIEIEHVEMHIEI